MPVRKKPVRNTPTRKSLFSFRSGISRIEKINSDWINLAMTQNQVALATELSVKKYGILLKLKVCSRSRVPTTKNVNAKTSIRLDLVTPNLFNPYNKIAAEMEM